VLDPFVVSAEVPASPDFVQVLRNVAAGVAARLEMPIDHIEEVRLAVTESASLLLDEASPTVLRVALAHRDGGLDVRISSDSDAEPWPADRIEASWAWLVVKGLTDQVQLEREADGSPSIVFSKHGRVAR
jgi:serine/threonine-protein kinase RsbW